jgi:hypothetical protein
LPTIFLIDGTNSFRVSLIISARLKEFEKVVIRNRILRTVGIGAHLQEAIE